MDFYKVEDGKLLFYAPLAECSCCHKPMVNWYKDVPREVLHQAKLNHIEKETYRESGVCESCAAKGGFLKACDCCEIKKEFPKSFKYQAEFYPEYPDSETEYQYICLDCIDNQPKSVIEILASADEVSEVKDAG